MWGKYGHTGNRTPGLQNELHSVLPHYTTCPYNPLPCFQGYQSTGFTPFQHTPSLIYPIADVSVHQFLVYHMTSFLTCQAIVPFYRIVWTGPQCVHHVGKSCDTNVGKIWTHWESNSRPPECITWHAPLLHHMPLQSTSMFPGLPINRIYPLSTRSSSAISMRHLGGGCSSSSLQLPSCCWLEVVFFLVSKNLYC